MASFILGRGDIFPEGTTVGAYPLAAPPDGVPGVAATESRVMSAGRASFSALAAETRYVFGAQVSGTWRYVSGRTPVVGPAPGRGNVQAFNVKDYGATGDNVANDYPAIQATIDAAVAAGGGIVYVPEGNFLLSTAQGSLKLPLNFAGHIVIRGAGRKNTRIRLTANCATFVSHNAVVAGDTMQNVTIEDLTVVSLTSLNVVGYSGVGVICQFAGLAMSIANVTIRRVDAENVGNIMAGGLGRRCINMVSTAPWPTDPTTRTVTDVLIEDCKLGVVGGGSNTGVHIAVSVQGGARPTVDRFQAGQFGTANYWYDRITLRNCVHIVGTKPTVFATSANFQLVGHGRGGKLLVDSCYGSGAADVGIEVDSPQHLTVRDTYIEDSVNAAFFIANNHGGDNQPERSVIRFVNCTAKATAGVGTATFKGFASASIFGSEQGHLIFDKCVILRQNTDFNGQTGAQGFNVVGAHRSVTMRDCSYTHNGAAFNRVGLPAATSYTVNVDAVRLNLFGAACRLLIDGFDYEASGSLDQGAGTGTLALAQNTINMQHLGKVQMDIRNVRSRGEGFTLAGAVAPTNRLREITLPQTAANTDDMSGDAFLFDVIADQGAVADFAQAAGVLTSAANHGTKRRLRWLDANGSSGALTQSNDQIGRQQDGTMLVVGTSPSALAGWELGAYLKGSDDGTTYLEGVVTDDGSASTLVIRKVLAGVTTVLGSKAIARLAASTGYGVRLKAQGNVVTLDLFSGLTSQLLSTAGTLDSTSITLAGADSSNFGADSPMGWIGVSWTPVDATATIDSVRNDRMAVFGGVLSRFIPAAIRQGMTSWTGIRLLASTLDNRIMGVLRIRDSDFSNRRGHGTVLDAELNGNTMRPFIHFDRHLWAIPPSMNGVIAAPGSGVAYVNADLFTEDVFIYGGTLTTPFVEVSRDGGVTWAQIAGASVEKVVRLDPGDQMRATYSAAPTFRKVPVV